MTDTIDAIDHWTAVLRREGWCVIPGALPAATIAALNADLDQTFAATPFCQGGFYGETTKRFGRVIARSPHAPVLAQHDLILGVVSNFLSPWCDTIQINVAQAIAIHPGAPSQLPHRDQDMWRGPVGEIEYLVNVIWPLTPFTAANGATRMWSRTHGAAALLPEFDGEPIDAIMAPGDALVFLGSALHGAGANSTDAERRGIVIGYSLGWLKPYENPWLAYPPSVARSFEPALAALVGYRQHRPNLGNFEGRCPSILLGDDVPEHLAAIDALRPDQAAVVAGYVAAQRRIP
ncbi:phytanoyl-CoA dioxygenase family protein [Sphingomonas pruni]|uniref:phytanoyl-CoA dioxygenase family protein n=1 Tax=Sphingomonas pruni TaxID=40683 RepID=UPI000A028671|nr:phytanoyl-CoA dioxygenase family protein [Sphingomonas pruni]